MFPKSNITIIPFRYSWCSDNQEIQILKHLEDVIETNERYIKCDSIGFPLMMLKSATQQGYDLLGRGNDLAIVREKEKKFQDKWCCFGHYYLYLLKKALCNKGYSAIGVAEGEVTGNLINKTFIKKDGTTLWIHADAGL